MALRLSRLARSTVAIGDFLHNNELLKKVKNFNDNAAQRRTVQENYNTNEHPRLIVKTRYSLIEIRRPVSVAECERSSVMPSA